MAENNFLAGMRTEQFIKTNNEQIKEALGESLDGVTKSVSEIMKLQRISTKTLGGIDKKLSGISNIDKTVSKIYDIQKSQLKLQESKDKDLSKSLDNLMSRHDTRMNKIISGMGKRERVKSSVASTAKDMFKRESPNEERDDLLETISGGIGTLVGFEQKKKKGKGLLGMLGLTGGIGLLMGAGGLIGWLMTGKDSLLLDSLKGGKWMLKGLAKGIGASIKGVFGFGPDAVKGTGSILKLFDGVGDLIKGAKNLSKIFSKFGFKGVAAKGMKTLGKKFGKAGAKTALSSIPGLGTIMGVAFGIKRFIDGDVVGGLLELGSGAADLIPGIGVPISLAIDAYLLKRDLTTSAEAIKEQSRVLTDPIGSVRTLFQGRRNRQEYEESQSLDPSFRRGIDNLRSLSMEQRRGFGDWQTRTYGSELNVSNNSEKAQYEQRVAEYRRSLGVGGGGFGTDSDLIANRNKTYFGVGEGKQGGIGAIFRRLMDNVFGAGRRPRTGARYNNAGRDDTFVSGTTGGFNTSLQRLMNSEHRNSVRLNGAQGFRPDLYGVNSTMRNKFFSMAQEFNTLTGGYLLVNSGKRNGSGSSVHNTGYAIDVNAIGPDGQRYGDGYVPEELLEKHGFHRPLLSWRSIYGGLKDEPWHIEPFPGESTYGGPRNSLAPDQPYRRGVLLAGGNAYSNNVGGGGFNLPQGNVERKADSGTSEVRLTTEDIEKLAVAFGRQIRENTPTPERTITPSSSGSNGRRNI